MRDLATIFIIAKLSSREWIRLKFFHIIVFFGLIFIGFSHLLSSLTFSVQERLLYDFGLAGLELGLVMISSLIGSHSIQREIDRKTLLVLLSRPIKRSHIVLGLWSSILSLCLLFSFGFILSLVLSSGGALYFKGILIATIATILKSMVIASFAIACGLVVRPILALGATMVYWILCYSMPDIQFFVSKLDDKNLTDIFIFLDKLVPQFYRFNWKTYYYITNHPSQSEVLWSITHSLGWVCFWLFLATMFFRKKEIV